MFSSFTVQPFIGSKSALLEWVWGEEEDPEEIHVCRSADGLPPWKSLTGADPLVEGETSYLDSSMPVTGLKVHEVYYQLVARVGGETVVSKKVGMAEQMRGDDIGTVRRLRWDEFEVSRCEGNLALYFRPNRSGSASPQIDPISLQNGNSCPPTTEGSPVTAGYGSPLQTYIRYSHDSRIQAVDEDSVATEDLTRQARLLAWPRPAKNDLIIQPYTDERWVVGEVTDTFRYKGKWDLAHSVKLIAIKKDELRYKIPIPEDLDDVKKAWL